MRRAAALGAVLLFTVPLSWVAREAESMRFNYPETHAADGTREPLTFHEPGEWFSPDPDGLYHTRRLARTLEEGLPPAATDPLMNSPDGAPIPWPPYYTWLLRLAPGSWAGRDPEALEHAVATVPMVFGVLASALAAGCGFLLAGTPGGLLAGGLHALCYGSIHYSPPGVGDHHAFVTCLAALLFLCLGLALQRGVLERPRAALGYGALCGLITGVLLGSWVGSLWYLLLVQAALGLLLFRYARGATAGLAPLGLAYHLAAALALLPAVLGSPWKAEFPWMVVNLSWFHLAFLLLGALVFVPMPRLPPWSRARKRYPFLVGGALAALAALLFLLSAGPAAGIREGFAWASRADSFMSTVAESEPLLGADRTGTGGLFTWLGFGVLALPVAWGAALLALQRRPQALPLLPWLLAVPLFLAASLAQRRFADGLAVPMAVLLAWGGAELLQTRWGRRLGAGRRTLACVAAVALLQAPALEHCRLRLQYREENRVSTSVFRQGAWRMLVEWLRLYAQDRGRGAVLANWDLGHLIEWGAGLPTVATNFGSYVGVESFQAPARFFLAHDPAAVEELLKRHDVRYVLLHSGLPDSLEALQQSIGEPEARWRGCLAERLMPVGTDFHRGDETPVRYLRLVHVPPLLDPIPSARFGSGVKVPCGWIWEYVPGAQLQAQAPELSVELQVEYSSGRTYRYRDSATAGADGIARLRLPWATTERNGDGVVTSATWSTGAGSRPLEVPEDAVLEGRRIQLQ